MVGAICLGGGTWATGWGICFEMVSEFIICLPIVMRVLNDQKSFLRPRWQMESLLEVLKQHLSDLQWPKMNKYSLQSSQTGFFPDSTVVAAYLRDTAPRKESWYQRRHRRLPEWSKNGMKQEEWDEHRRKASILTLVCLCLHVSTCRSFEIWRNHWMFSLHSWSRLTSDWKGTAKCWAQLKQMKITCHFWSKGSDSTDSLRKLASSGKHSNSIQFSACAESKSTQSE